MNSEVTWRGIAARNEHIIDGYAYEVLYGAPNIEADRVAWIKWVDEASRKGRDLPVPLEFHTPDCPRCWSDQWKVSP